MAETFLRVQNIKKSFEGVQALKGVDLEIGQGEICCLVGENGCGKSTLIKIITGVYTPDDGTIEIDGTVYSKLNPIEAKRKGVEVIFQDFSVFPNMTVAENIAMNALLGEEKKRVNWSKMRAIAKEALERIHVDLDINACVGELSVASKQLVAIARALVHDSRLIIMDEATAALTRKEVDQLFAVVETLKARGIAVLFVSHKLDEVLEIAQKVIVFRNGEHIITGPRADFDEDKIIYYMTGRNLQRTYYEPADEFGQELMRVEGLGRSGGFKDISFTLRAGEIIGIMGPLGSGRTALANALFGIRPAEQGDVYINGEKKSIKTVWDAMECGIAYVPEDRLTEGLFLARSINVNAVSSILEKMVTKKLYDKRKVREEASKQIQELHIKVGGNELPAQSLSGGNQQKLLMGKWLATKPQILILNGPTVGVDIGSKTDIYEIIKDLAKNGMGIILISDEVQEVLYNSSKVYVMEHGQLTFEADPHSILEADLLAHVGVSDDEFVGDEVR